MIIGVTGDTHNNLKNIKQICSIFNKNRVDYVFHTGDVSLPKSLLAFKALKCPLKVILGNNDIEEAQDLIKVSKKWDCKIFHEPFTINLAGKRICIVHHPELISDELLKNNDLILHGHTHRVRKEILKNTLIFNPGECAGFMKNKNQVGVVDLKTLSTEIFTF